MKKIGIGIGLMVLGGIIEFIASAATIKVPGMLAVNVSLMVFGVIVIIAGSVLLVLGLYKWQRKKAVDIIAEGVKKGREEEKK